MKQFFEDYCEIVGIIISAVIFIPAAMIADKHFGT